MKYCFVADVFVDEVLGGGELNNEVLINTFISRGIEIGKIKSNLVTIRFLKSNINTFFIIANFVTLSYEAKEFLQQHCTYVIYEHDHKYLRSRNPALYKDFKAPNEEIVNYNFYRNAMRVFCQSSFHKNIVYKNLEIDNIINLSGNLWEEGSLNIMKIISTKEKQDTCAIMNSPIPNKNTRTTVQYCDLKEWKYVLVASSNYQEFLSLLGNNRKLIFMPTTPETLSRLVVEARMMGMSVITNHLVGASYEPWFELKGKELISYVNEMRNSIPQMIMDGFG